MIQIQVSAHRCFMVGAPAPTVQALAAQMWYLSPDAEGNPDYAAGHWDGRIYLLKGLEHGHEFPTGLLERVCKLLDMMGIAYNIEWYVRPLVRDPRLAALSQAPISVRPYQVTAAMACLSGRFRKGGIIQMATGGGKTRTAAKLIALAQVPTVFLVNQKDLQQQVIDEFTKMLGIKIGQIGGGKWDPQLVTVATVQTIARAAGDDGSASLDTLAERVEILAHMATVGLVIMDEAHGVAARTARAAVESATQAMAVVGLSASPWRDDGLDILIEAACGAVVYKISASELIDLGYLVPPEIQLHNMPQPKVLTKAHGDVKKYAEFYRAWVVDNDYRTMYIAGLCNWHSTQGHVTIVLVKQIDHGELLNALIPNSVFMQGKLSGKRRHTILADVRAGVTRVLIATSLADQGLDIPIACALVLAGGGKSSTKALQRIGRVLRPFENKVMAWVHDIVDAHSNLKKHYRERAKIYATEPRFALKQVFVPQEK